VTIAHFASTGVNNALTTRGTVSIAVAYPASSVAAGRIAIIMAEGKLNTATWGTDPSGFTKILDTTGGASGSGSDLGPVRIGVWYKVLTGSESGSVTVSLTSGTQVTAVMSVYTKTGTNWVVPTATAIGATAKNTNSTNVSISSPAWGWPPRNGDMMVAMYAANSDGTTTAASAPTITQSGATIGTVNLRNRLSGSDGNQGSIFSWDGLVSSGGSSSATVIGLTWGQSSSGVGAVLRLREVNNVAISTLTDNFDDNVVNTAIWDGNYGTTSETGGRARVATSTTYSGFESVPQYSLDSSGVFVQFFPAALNGATTEAYAGFFLLTPSQAPGTDIGISVDRISGTINFVSRVNSSDASSVSLTYDATAHAWIKMALVSGNVIWSTSPDGATWTQRRSASVSYVANTIDFGISMESHRGEGTANFSEWDNLNIPQISNISSGTISLSAQSSLAGNGIASTTGSATLTSQSTLNVSGSNTTVGAASLTAQSNLVSIASPLNVQGSTTLSGQSTLVSAGFGIVTGVSSLTAQSNLSSSGATVVSGTAALTIQSSLSATGIRLVSGTSVLTGQSTLTGAGFVATTGVSTLSAQSSMSAGAFSKSFGIAGLTTQSTLTASGTRVLVGIASLSGQSTLAATGAVSTVVNAGLTVQSNMSVIGTVIAYGSATLTSQSSSAVTGANTVVVGSALSGQSTLTGAGFNKAIASAALTGQSIATTVASNATFATSALTSQSNVAATGLIGTTPANAILSAQSNLTFTVSNNVVVATGLSAQSTLAVSGFVKTTGASTFSAASNMNTSAIVKSTDTVGLSSQLTLTVSGNVATTPVVIGMTSQSSLSVAGSVVVRGISSLTAQSNVVSVGNAKSFGSATFTIQSSIIVNGTRTLLGTVTMSAQSTMVTVGSIALIFQGTANLSASVDMDVEGHEQPPWVFPFIEFSDSRTSSFEGMGRAQTYRDGDSNVNAGIEGTSTIMSIEGG